MSKRELIDEILRLNPTAKPDFLAHFKEKDLQEYLDHLNWLNAPAIEPARRPAALAAQESAQRQETATAVAVMDAADDAAEASEQIAAEEALAEDSSLDEAVVAADSAAVATDDESREPAPFADQSQEDPQTYLF